MLMSKEIIGLDEKYNKDIKDMWIFDSGATSHMTNNSDGLYNIKECLESVEYGKSDSGSISKIKGYLDVRIRNLDGTINDMTLKYVLYIQDLTCNVISVFFRKRESFQTWRII